MDINCLSMMDVTLWGSLDSSI